MKITESKLRRVIRQVINESADVESHKESVIAQFKEDSFRWQRYAQGDFYHFADGGDGDGMRHQYYPGWSDKNFIDVIIAIDGSYRPRPKV